MSDETTWVGPEAFRATLRPVSSLRTHPENPRRGDIPKIATSLRAFGQQKPIIVYPLDGQDTIFAGNHTYRAAVEELGWTHIAVSVPDYLGPEEADAYLYMDNAASDRATYDYGELIQLLEERERAGTIDRTGFTTSDLSQMRKDAAELAGSAISEFQTARDEEPAPEPAAAASAPPTPPLRQMLLSWRDTEEFDRWAMKIQTLRREFGTEDISATVEEILDRAVKLELKT